jgi:hypothetical protein
VATTINEVSSHAAGGVNFLHLKLTAGGADSSVTYTIVPGQVLKGVTLPVKTTGSAGAVNLTYVESTGVLTASCSANDVLRLTVMY